MPLPTGANRFLCVVLRPAWVCAVGVCLFGGAYCVVSYSVDTRALHDLAQLLTRNEPSPDRQALALMHYVHRSGGTRQNPHWFGWPGWRATSMQVVETGGDCADKARLLVALLHGVGLTATSALCFDADNGSPAHTLVEAKLPGGVRMILDPAFDLHFPRPGGGYYGVSELRGDPDIVERRVQEHRGLRDAHRRSQDYYLRARADYSSVSTFHWNRGPVTRGILTMLRPVLGERVYSLYRPLWIEEPKLKAAVVCITSAGVLAMLAVLIRQLRSLSTERCAYAGGTGTDAAPCAQ